MIIYLMMITVYIYCLYICFCDFLQTNHNLYIFMRKLIDEKVKIINKCSNDKNINNEIKLQNLINEFEQDDNNKLSRDNDKK